ncbi:DUF5316 domain-containing protein [Bacillus paralicheniformis]|uniref:DUF5316 domain-containing protein n=1 Tax=Bacillus paralicheniformis TaxID=1648923 RepID=UPI002DBBD83E|nr:DUF5316 domain-containing protein [Bacillus paralicheniformis]MEC1282938.1 DUF5316 domain-containing protein [Bacillus paralicheniformis]MEC1298079.1 DUF5316 domain-containing protein [Bacillus paralicheniformis]
MIAVLISVVAGDWTLIFKVSGAAGLGTILLSALCSGVFVSGDRFRGNHDSETKEHREWNGKLANTFAVFAMPNLLAAGISFFFAF